MSFSCLSHVFLMSFSCLSHVFNVLKISRLNLDSSSAALSHWEAQLWPVAQQDKNILEYTRIRCTQNLLCILQKEQMVFFWMQLHGFCCGANMSLHFCFADVFYKDSAGQRSSISAALRSCFPWWKVGKMMKLMKIDEIMLPFASICPKVGFWRWNTGDTCGHGGHGGHGSPVNMARLARDSARLPSLFGRKSLEQRTPPAS